jgi:hypothetical protein
MPKEKMKSHKHDSISVYKTTKAELLKRKTKSELLHGHMITWDDFLLALVKHDKDIESFI